MGFAEVELIPRSIDRWRDILPDDRWHGFAEAMRLGRAALAGRPIWHVNSTATGGGVAEMLRTIGSYLIGSGLDVHWGVIEGDPQFFRVTKRLHNFIHGDPGDGGDMGWRQRDAYHRTMRANIEDLEAAIPAGAVVMCHDPQTAGLIDGLRRRGCSTLWRCHIGTDNANAYSDRAWKFLEPFISSADRVVFSRSLHIPPVLAGSPVSVVHPSIDPFAPKNQLIEPERVEAILRAAALIRTSDGWVEPVYYRLDGHTATVHTRAILLGSDIGLTPGRPLILQVSRWDRLKDHKGVLQGFVEVAEHVDAELMLVGPDASGVTDDPEGAAVFEELTATHASLPAALRARVHIAALPMTDIDDNAVIVNALQRYASIVVQKSLQEGFGLTVTEAMLKGRPMVASRVGGITDQIVHDKTGVLVDPTDLDRFGETLKTLLGDQARRERLGKAGRASAHDAFLDDRHIRKMLHQLITVCST